METVVTIVSILASLAGAVLYLDRKIVNLDHKLDTLRLESIPALGRTWTAAVEDGAVRVAED